MKCINCFEEINDHKVCPNCGFNEESYVNQPHYLKAGSTLVQGRYIIGCAVGAGGFGITYAAWDSFLNIRVAIKEYLPGEFSTRIMGETKLTVYGGEKEEQFNAGLVKFVEEGKRLAKFREVEGVVHIYDTIEENGTAYIIMEFLEGETLAQRIEREGKIAPDEAVTLFIPILDALQVVHEKEIIHRDIAPNNIYLCSDGRVKLIDFGASRSATGTHSKSLTVLYKQGFTAAEQYQSRGEQGPWTDVYSVAASLYNAVTGIVPPDAMERYHKDRIKPIDKCGVRVSRNIQRAIMNAMNVKWQKRTQSTLQFKEELVSAGKVVDRYEKINEKAIGSIPLTFIIITAFLLISVGTFIGLIASGIVRFPTEVFTELFMENGKSRMISVINMEENEAKSRLEGIGLSMDVITEYSNTVVEGVVISQDIEKGTVLDEGSKVTVHVSKGYQEFVMPDVTNMTVDEASAELKGMNVTFHTEDRQSIMIKGTVVDQKPGAGETIREYSDDIVFYVSEGFAVDEEFAGEMPSVLGMTYDEAIASLQNMNIYIKPDKSGYSNEYDEGIVMGQSIVAGANIQGGETVEIQVSNGHIPVLMPSLVGINIDEATKMLENLNLKVESEWIEDKSLENYTVAVQSVEAFDITTELSTIKLTYVNNDPEVPNFINGSEYRVKTVCQENGWILKRTSYAGTRTYIARQTPEPGTKLPAGETVSIAVEVIYEDYHHLR